VNMMPLHNQILSVFAFLENFQEPPSDFEGQFWVFEMNHLATRVSTPGASLDSFSAFLWIL